MIESVGRFSAKERVVGIYWDLRYWEMMKRVYICMYAVMKVYTYESMHVWRVGGGLY